MSALAKMLADMLLKELSPEVREQLSPENLSRLGGHVGAFFKEQKTQGVLLRQIADKLGIEYASDSDSNAGSVTGEPVKRIGSG